MKKEQIGMDLSIIVPVYNVEKYIRACIESIYRQGLDENCFELIIVNDGTKDQSMNIIGDILNHHNNITIINQDNQGLSVARNNGIAIAKGEYILMPDSDDLLIDHSIIPLLEKALSTQADLVVADFIKLSNDEIASFGTKTKKPFSYKEMSGTELLLEDLNPYHCYVWRTLFRREFLIENHLEFVPGVYYQDVPFTHECYLKAKRCLRCSWLLNIYRKRPGAATFSFDKNKARSFSIVISKTWNLTKIKGLTPQVEQKLRDDVWASFSNMLRLTCHYIKDGSERIKIIDYLKQTAPALAFSNGKKQRIVTWLYKTMPHTFIRLYYIYLTVFEKRPF